MDNRRIKLGTVAGPHPRTAQAGMAMLKAGGNAVDAAVAAAFTEGVVDPSYNGVAGYGGSMVIYLAGSSRVVAVDFNSTAPAAASERMFRIEKAPPPAGYRVPDRVNTHGPLSVGVPGIVAGLCLALRRFGTMDLADVLKPAINAARYGSAPNTVNRDYIKAEADRWKREFPETARVFLKNGRPPKKGERLTNPELARTLEAIAEGGPSVFYTGPLAETIATHIQELGGCLTAEELRAYRPRVVKPYEVSYRGHQLYTPPLGSGGLTTCQMLRLLESHDIADMPLAERLHHCAEAMKASWPERLRRYGDPAFVDVDIAAELSDQFIARLQRRLKNGVKSPGPGRLVNAEPNSCTSHISTADVDGTLVSLTQTHGGSFGSMVTVPGTGLLLGHGVARFNPQPGLANSIAPGKRPLHNMSPFVALKNGAPFATYGLPGGRTIPNNQLSLSLNMIDLGMTPGEALAAARLHTEGAEPLQLEKRAGKAVAEALQKRGHQVERTDKIGGPGHAITLSDDPAVQSGGTDPRHEGRVLSA